MASRRPGSPKWQTLFRQREEVLLRLTRAALNPADRYLAEGQYPAKPPRLSAPAQACRIICWVKNGRFCGAKTDGDLIGYIDIQINRRRHPCASTRRRAASF
jgi:hypothetical protein